MRAMSRIPCQQSTQSIIVSLGAGLCRNTQGSKVIARSRINPIVRTPDRPCFFSTSQRSTARKKKDQDSSVDAAKIDSISKALINDLYTRPSSVKAKVTLEDVMALKPLNPKISVEEFNKLKDRVAASFNVSQLKGVLRSKNMPSGGKKSVLINQIMVLMDLDVLAPEPGPPVVEEPFPNDPTVQREYPSSKQELFFILGTEGDSLRQLEKEKNVRISINIADETYVIRGVPHLIEEAQERIRELVAVTEEQWDVSSYHNRDMVMKEPLALEDIARRSGTYVSSKDDQTLIIAGRSERSMEEAKRLFDIKLNESTCHVESLTFTRQENELNPLGMFPVYDSVTMTADENQKAYFRICQVEPYADKTMDNHTIYPVQSSPSNINTLQELKEHLQSNVNEAQTATQKFELSSHFGQVLFQNKERKMTCLPLSKSFDMLMLEEWLKDAEAPYFFESLPFFKAVAKLPLVSPKTRTIEAEYILSSCFAQSSLNSLDKPKLDPVHLSYQLNHEGELFMKGGSSINKRIVANFMMLGQPTDVQIRSQLTTKLEIESPILKNLMDQTTLPFSNRLQCPNFFSFQDISSTPPGSQVGLRGVAITHTLKSVLFKTTGIFDYHGLPLIASDMIDQYGLVRKQELKLLPVPLAFESISADGDVSLETISSAASQFDHWDEFIKATFYLNKAI